MNSKESSPVGELVERLRHRAKTLNGSMVGASDGATYALGYYDQFAAKDDKEAAELIAALEAENARLREALEPFAEATQDLDETAQDRHDIWEHPVAVSITVAHLRAARRVREGGKVDG